MGTDVAHARRDVTDADADATVAHQRLIELGEAANDWAAAARNASLWPIAQFVI